MNDYRIEVQKFQEKRRKFERQQAIALKYLSYFIFFTAGIAFFASVGTFFRGDILIGLFCLFIGLFQACFAVWLRKG